MIDTVVKLLDKITDLLKARQEGKRRTVDVLITPIFTNLKTVHEDYLRLLEGARVTVSEDSELTELAKRFMAGRLTQEALRRSLGSFAGNYSKNRRLKKYKGFFDAVIAYLYSAADLSSRNTRSTIVLLEIQKIAGIESGDRLMLNFMGDPRYRETLVQMIDGFLSEIRAAWDRVSSEYAIIAGDIAVS